MTNMPTGLGGAADNGVIMMDDLDEAVSPVFLFAVLGSWSDYLVSSVKSTLIYHQIYP